jgi:hypothetical protein
MLPACPGWWRIAQLRSLPKIWGTVELLLHFYSCFCVSNSSTERSRVFGGAGLIYKYLGKQTFPLPLSSGEALGLGMALLSSPKSPSFSVPSCSHSPSFPLRRRCLAGQLPLADTLAKAFRKRHGQGRRSKRCGEGPRAAVTLNALSPARWC